MTALALDTWTTVLSWKKWADSQQLLLWVMVRIQICVSIKLREMALKLKNRNIFQRLIHNYCKWMNLMSTSILSIQTNGWLHQNVDQTKLSSPCQSRWFTVVGRITRETGYKGLNLCGLYLMLLKPSVE